MTYLNELEYIESYI